MDIGPIGRLSLPDWLINLQASYMEALIAIGRDQNSWLHFAYGLVSWSIMAMIICTHHI